MELDITGKGTNRGGEKKNSLGKTFKNPKFLLKSRLKIIFETFLAVTSV